MNKTKYIALLLLLIGSILRLSWFWQPSFTGDEAGHMMKAVSVTRGIADFIFNRNRPIALQNIVKPILEHNHPPLEFLILLPSVPFYPREFSARLIYVMNSLTTLVVGFWIVYKRRGKVVAIAFLALLGTSSFLVWFSQMITFGLNLTGGILIGLGLLTFAEKPTSKTLLFLILSTVFALLVSLDFLLFVPAVIWSIFRARDQFSSSFLIKMVCVGVLLLAVFYVPYVGYSLLPDSPKAAGFIHYRSYLTYDRSTQIGSYFSQGIGKFLLDKWQQFFSLPGVWTVWPWSLSTLLSIRKKRPEYLKYLWLIIIIIFLIEVPTIPCCTVYLNLFGPLLLLAAEGIALIPHYSIMTIMVLTIINITQAQPILQGVPNPITFHNWQKKTDHVREVGQLVKPCFTGEETYISTEDAWRARYYFGRPMLPTVEYEMTTEEIAIEQFLRGDLPQVVVIHVHTPIVSEAILSQLKIRALNYRELHMDKIYFFKNCPSSGGQTIDTVGT